MSVTIGGRTFYFPSETVVADASGTRWLVSDIEGWTSGGRTEIDSTFRRPRGVVPSSRHLGRSLTFKGMADSPSVAARWSAITALADAFDAIESDTLLVVNEPTPKQAYVRRDGEIETTKAGLALGFEVPLLAPDPLKYAASQSSLAISPVAATANNAGTIRTAPVIEVSATAVAAGVTDIWNDTTGERIQLSAIPANTTVVIDVANLGVTIAGANRFDLIVLANTTWWELVPGNNSIRRTAGTSGTLRWRSAWS